MLTKEENELLTRIGPGTRGGDMLRRYWIPALLSWELPEPDCPPVRVKLLGEPLVAFRDTGGRAGILGELCPHRLASLWLGRNEEYGLRCIYHGWKYDVDGNCVDQMNEPDSFAHKIKAKAYPTQERGGIIWTYMGPPELQPAPPDFEWTRVAETHRAVTKVWEECNWLQALEGGIDTSHAPILHRAISKTTTRAGIALSTPFVRGGKPTLDVDITDYGYRYTGIRPLGESEQYVRGYHFVMPFTQLRPSQIGRNGAADKTVVSGHYWVPIDDENTMVWNWHYSYGEEPLGEEERTMDGSGNGRRHVNWENEFRSYVGKAQNWGVDRQVQKYETFSGIDGVNQQDRAVQESMGAIVDRTQEHLGPADKAIIASRRLLLDLSLIHI